MRVIIAIFAALALGACTGPSIPVTPGYEQIFGSWRCTLQQGDMFVETTTTYHRDGRFNGAGIFRGQQGGETLTFTMNGAGTWSNHGDRLIETAQSITVTTLTRNGVAVPPSDPMMVQLQTQMRQMSGRTSENRIERIDPQIMTMMSEGNRVNCVRA